MALPNKAAIRGTAMIKEKGTQRKKAQRDVLVTRVAITKPMSIGVDSKPEKSDGNE